MTQKKVITNTETSYSKSWLYFKVDASNDTELEVFFGFNGAAGHLRSTVYNRVLLTRMSC